MDAERYGKLADGELLRLFRAGDGAVMDFLLEKYKPMVRRLTRARYLAGGEEDDLLQEGMIGLFKAVMGYDEARCAAFSTFAYLCVVRQLETAITASNRKKNDPLNHSEPLPEENDASGAASLTLSPEHLVIERETADEMLEKIRVSLSKMEKEVLRYYLAGLEYTEIAARMGRPPKSIDNALQRIRKKTRAALP
ncbi:MAG: sigma-70 family RNA polymerase sigma factor [Lachnospiraceae bacterium]|nr:sigma-70 family RNA polymerase sigma factor [Lachnospiraceae bacterium]